MYVQVHKVYKLLTKIHLLHETSWKKLIIILPPFSEQISHWTCYEIIFHTFYEQVPTFHEQILAVYELIVISNENCQIQFIVNTFFFFVAIIASTIWPSLSSLFSGQWAIKGLLPFFLLHFFFQELLCRFFSNLRTTNNNMSQ